MKFLINIVKKVNIVILILEKRELKVKNILGVKELFKLIKGIFYFLKGKR